MTLDMMSITLVDVDRKTHNPTLDVRQQTMTTFLHTRMTITHGLMNMLINDWFSFLSPEEQRALVAHFTATMEATK